MKIYMYNFNEQMNYKDITLYIGKLSLEEREILKKNLQIQNVKIEDDIFFNRLITFYIEESVCKENDTIESLRNYHNIYVLKFDEFGFFYEV